MSGVEQTRLAELKFAEEHIEPILAGRKTATIRYEIDSHDALRIGRTFHLLDEDGERFASAIVHDRGYTTAEWIVENGVEGHEPYHDLESFYKQMREYYPRAELGPKTCFEIIYWEWGELWE
ncbi:ASCH domain-containing protein [Saliphagus sp. GCM10025334]